MNICTAINIASSILFYCLASYMVLDISAESRTISCWGGCIFIGN